MRAVSKGGDSDANRQGNIRKRYDTISIREEGVELIADQGSLSSANRSADLWGEWKETRNRTYSYIY